MVRLILIATAVFLALYLLSQRLSFSQKDNDGEGGVLGQRSGGFLIAVTVVIAVLSLIFILPRVGISLLGLLQKALAFSPIIRAFLPF